MCTLILLHRPRDRWPTLIGANRDEMRSRPSAPPGRHWPERPQIVAGLDLEAGGTWLGVNDLGLIAAVLDRTGTLGPEPGRRSRGGLVLDALGYSSADKAASQLSRSSPRDYRPFNLVLADRAAAFWIRHGGDGPIRCEAVPTGLHLICSTDLDDPQHPRIALNRPRLLRATPPNPQTGDWEGWRSVLSDPSYPQGLGPEAAMVQARQNGFGTRSSALIGLPAAPDRAPVWLHAEGSPDRTAFRAVALDPSA
jgi:hypothetical protein